MSILHGYHRAGDEECATQLDKHSLEPVGSAANDRSNMDQSIVIFSIQSLVIRDMPLAQIATNPCLHFTPNALYSRAVTTVTRITATLTQASSATI